jgi:hypothetical protein
MQTEGLVPAIQMSIEGPSTQQHVQIRQQVPSWSVESLKAAIDVGCCAFGEKEAFEYELLPFCFYIL